MKLFSSFKHSFLFLTKQTIWGDENKWIDTLLLQLLWPTASPGRAAASILTDLISIKNSSRFCVISTLLTPAPTMISSDLLMMTSTHPANPPSPLRPNPTILANLSPTGQSDERGCEHLPGAQPPPRLRHDLADRQLPDHLHQGPLSTPESRTKYFVALSKFC